MLHLALPALAFLVAFSFGAVPERACNDVWWHLRTGEFIAQNGYRLPVVDPFNFMANDQGIAWHNHEWLGQIVFYWVYRAGEAMGADGLHALFLAKALLLGATYLGLALFCWRFSGAMLPAVIAAVLAAEVGRRTFYARPPVYTYVLLIALYWLMHEVRARRLPRRYLVAVLPMFCLWANLHGGWAAGGVLLGCFMLGEAAESLARHYRTTPLIALPRAFLRDVAPWAGACALAVIGTLGNPSGVHLYAIFDRVLSDHQLVASIGELQPPIPALSLFFYASFLGMLMMAMALRRPFPHMAELLFIPFFAWQSLQHVRHLTLYGILMAPAFAWMMAEVFRQYPRGVAGLMRVLALGALLGLVVWGLAWRSEGGTFIQRNRAFASGESFVRANYPADAARFLREASLLGVGGRLYNLDYYAGYLIWRLAPEPFRVMSDPRFDIFGGDIQRQANRLTTAPPGWDAELRALGVDAALLPLNKYLTHVMIADPGWHLVFHQPAWRRQPDGSVALDRFAGWAVLVRDDAYPPATLERLEALGRRHHQALGLPDVADLEAIDPATLVMSAGN